MKFLIGLSFIILVGLASFFVFRGGKKPENITRDSADIPILEQPAQKDVYDSFTGDWVSIGISFNSRASISRGKTGNIILSWNNLPQNTSYINIFRRSADSNSWIKWKTITIISGETNSLSVDGGYKYAIQAVSEEGNILWSSQASAVVVSGGPVSSGPSVPPAQSNPTSPLTTPPTPNQSPQPILSAPAPTGDIYNVKGEVVGYQPKQTANFWVYYVNKEIELGWQNLPPDTNRLAIDRSVNSNVWVRLFEQLNPKISSDFIRLIDETFTQPYYYKFNAYADDQLLAIYGPLYLAPYSN